MDRRKATMDGYSILLIVVVAILSVVLLPYGFVVIPILILFLLYQSLLRVIFQGPPVRSLVLNHPDYQLIHTMNNGVDVYGFVHYQPKKSDIVVLMHGWQSSSEKFFERIELFKNLGVHVLSHDMRGHGIAPDTPEWTAGKVMQDLKILLNQVDKNKVKKIHFYGHSLGGFICLGLQNERHDGWWKDRQGTLMLESPMTAYRPIFEELSSKFSFMLPWMKKWAINGFKKIHPETPELTWEDVEVPLWGLPKVPTLLLQAENDNRLGRYHYDLLCAQEIELHPHLLQTLTHSTNRINQERDLLIEKWVKERIL